MLLKHRIPGLLFALVVALPGLVARAEGPHGPGPMSSMGPMHEGEAMPGPQCDGRKGMGPMSGGPGEYGIGECIERHAEELGLDDKTRAAIRGVVEKSADESRALRKEKHAAKRALDELLDAKDLDDDAIDEQVEKIVEIEKRAQRQRVETRVEVRKLLTPEQREKLAALRKEGREGFAKEIEAACGQEAERLCDESERKLTGMMCLHRHRDEVSEACREALRPRKRGDGPGERCGGSGPPHGPRRD